MTGDLQGPLPVRRITQAALQKQLAAHAAAQVVYIAADVHITDLQEAHQACTVPESLMTAD